MLVRCANCGAPLDADTSARSIKCPYCGTSNRTASTVQISAQTPQGWVPPPTWTPPPDARADSAELRYRDPRKAKRAWIASFAFLGVWVAGLGGYAFIRAREDATAPWPPPVGAEHRVPVARVAAASLSTSPAALARTFGVTPDEDGLSVSVPIEGSPWQTVSFDWDRSAPSHPNRVLVYSSTPVPAGAAAALRVGAILGRRFKRLEDGRYSGGPFYFSADGAQISMNLDPARGPELFRQSAAAAWDVLRSAVLGAPVQIDESTRRNFLGVGHRLASLAQVSSDMDIDGAEAALRALFPSVKRDGASFSIELDHPWFDWARLELENAAHGRFEGLTIGPFGSGTPAEQEAVAQCLTTVLGEPEVRETDHVAGTHSWSWGHVWKNDYVHTVQRLVMISIRKDASDPPRDRASLERIFTQLDTCGRN